MITPLEPLVTNLVEHFWMSLFVYFGELANFTPYFLILFSGMPLYAVIIAHHCRMYFFFYQTLYFLVCARI